MINRDICVACCLLLCTGAASGDDPPLPVFVWFQFHNPIIRESGATESMLSNLLAERLQNEYKLWKFQPVSAPDSFPLIRFWLRNNAEWDLHMSLMPQQGDDPQEWSVKLFLPEDMTRMGDSLPSKEGWKPEIGRAFTDKLMATKRDEVLKALSKRVCVGKKVEFDPNPPSTVPVQAILHLPKLNFENLADHMFFIKYRFAAEDVYLVSLGTGLYEDTRQGIRVVVREWRSASTPQAPVDSSRLAVLPQLVPVHFYVGERVDPTLSIAP